MFEPIPILFHLISRHGMNVGLEINYKFYEGTQLYKIPHFKLCMEILMFYKVVNGNDW